MLTPIDQFLKKSGSGLKIKLPESVFSRKTYAELSNQFGVPWWEIRKEFLRQFPNQRKHILLEERKKWKRFAKWDWFKTNAELAIEHGLTRERIRQIRKGLGIEKRKPWLTSDQWKEVDWGKTDMELASELGRSIGTVRMRRYRHDPDTGYSVLRELDRIKTCELITSEEWKSLTNEELKRRAIEINPSASVHWIIEWKKEHPGLNKPSKWNSKERYSGVDWNTMSTDVIARISGVGTSAARIYGIRNGYLKKLGIKPGESKKYAGADWSKSNQELAVQFGITKRSMSNVRNRFRNKVQST